MTTHKTPASFVAILSVCLLSFASGAGPGPAAVVLPAPLAASPATFIVNAESDAVADFSNDPNFTVCHTTPSNTTCTLRAAIMNANRHTGGGIINLPAGLYPIQIAPTGDDGDASGDLDLTNAITLIGAGPDSTIVDGGNLDGVFDIYQGGVVTMTGVTIRNGLNGKFDAGAGIDLQSHLSLSNSTLTQNFAKDGGAGLYVSGSGRATLDQVTVSDNGPVAIINKGALTITNSSLYNNDGVDSDGGAIANYNTGVLAVFNSTLSNNRSPSNGGAIANEGTATILASTIAGNLADDRGLAGAAGGGIYNNGSLQIGNSLLADNFVSQTVDECDSASNIVSLDYNFIQVANDCHLVGNTADNIVPGFLVPVLLLGPLAAHGGPTLTRALFPGHPAVDQIPVGLCRDLVGDAPVPDQRGVARPIGPKCDMGAIEGAPALPPYFRNLVFNGDGESSAGAPTAAWVGAAGWLNTLGQFTVVPYNAPGGFPSVPTDTVPSNRGLNFFAGGNAAVSHGVQTDPLPSELLGSINAGAVNFLLSADLGGFESQDDNAEVQIEFLNSGRHSVSPLFTLGPITSTQRADKTGFVHVAMTGTVPANAANVFVEIAMTRVFAGGSYNDGYADNVSLMLLPRHALFLPAILR